MEPDVTAVRQLFSYDALVDSCGGHPGWGCTEIGCPAPKKAQEAEQAAQRVAYDFTLTVLRECAEPKALEDIGVGVLDAIEQLQRQRDALDRAISPEGGRR